MADIALRGVTKRYPNGHVAVHDIDLDVTDGELLVLVGPSGCGKSTLLRMVAGLEEVTEGQITIGGRDVTDAAPKDRDIAMVFQSYALYPHLTVRRNIGYPLKLAKLGKAEIDKRVEEAARLLQLEPVLDRRPAQLSGGQRQRVAMGRAIVRHPRAFLMDEPLSNLDAKLRVQMRAEIARLQRDLAVTTIYVTHDQVEAMTMGSRVAVLHGGRIQQVDTPRALYERPANLFVAAFIGSPAMNLFRGRLVAEGSDLLACFGRHRLPLPADDVAMRTASRSCAGARPGHRAPARGVRGRRARALRPAGACPGGPGRPGGVARLRARRARRSRRARRRARPSRRRRRGDGRSPRGRCRRAALTSQPRRARRHPEARRRHVGHPPVRSGDRRHRWPGRSDAARDGCRWPPASTSAEPRPWPWPSIAEGRSWPGPACPPSPATATRWPRPALTPWRGWPVRSGAPWHRSRSSAQAFPAGCGPARARSATP